MAGSVTFFEMVEALGKPRGYVMTLQKQLGLHVPKGSSARYGEGYVKFMEKAIALKTFSVPMETIEDLLRLEQKILKLLHIDTLSDSPTWYLDVCSGDGATGRTLLLTGYDVGFPISAGVVQSHLNFGVKQKELFTSREMGEDIREVLKTYRERVEKIKGIIRKETPLIERALFWADDTFR